MGEVYIAGAAMTRVGRRDESLPDLMAEAGRGALAAAAVDVGAAAVVMVSRYPGSARDMP